MSEDADAQPPTPSTNFDSTLEGVHSVPAVLLHYSFLYCLYRKLPHFFVSAILSSFDAKWRMMSSFCPFRLVFPPEFCSLLPTVDVLNLASAHLWDLPVQNLLPLHGILLSIIAVTWRLLGNKRVTHTMPQKYSKVYQQRIGVKLAMFWSGSTSILPSVPWKGSYLPRASIQWCLRRSEASSLSWKAEMIY